MNQRLAELTNKLYQEGVEKGEKEAEAVLQQAKERADGILSDAKKEAEQIVAHAKKEAEELRRNTESEIKLAGNQLSAAIRQRILDMVTLRVSGESVGKTLLDPAVVKDYIKIVVEKFDLEKGAAGLEVLLPEKSQQEFEKAFKGGVQKVLGENVEVRYASGLKGGFQIGPKGDVFKISLTEEDFQELFNEFLRPKTRDLLFAE